MHGPMYSPILMVMKNKRSEVVVDSVQLSLSSIFRLQSASDRAPEPKILRVKP